MLRFTRMMCENAGSGAIAQAARLPVLPEVAACSTCGGDHTYSFWRGEAPSSAAKTDTAAIALEARGAANKKVSYLPYAGSIGRKTANPRQDHLKG